MEKTIQLADKLHERTMYMVSQVNQHRPDQIQKLNETIEAFIDEIEDYIGLENWIEERETPAFKKIEYTTKI